MVNRFCKWENTNINTLVKQCVEAVDSQDNNSAMLTSLLFNKTSDNISYQEPDPYLGYYQPNIQ
jgi:hypothetical protein